MDRATLNRVAALLAGNIWEDTSESIDACLAERIEAVEDERPRTRNNRQLARDLRRLRQALIWATSRPLRLQPISTQEIAMERCGPD